MIRREPFGGIIFDENSYKIYKLDKLSFRAVELFAQKMNLGTIHQTLKEEFEISFKVDDLKKFLTSIIKKFGESVIFKQRGCNTEDIWNQRWKGTHLSSPVLVYWTFTNLCNLGCTHCAWNSGKPLPTELNTEECKKIIDELVKLGVGYISFSGGEPLTKKKQLTEMANYAKKQGIPVGLATNATLIDKKTAKELKTIDFADIQISMEGLEAHDIIRGKGVYEKTIKGTKLLIEEGIPCTFAVAINKTNTNEIDNIIKLAKEIGVKRIRFVRFIPIGRGKSNYEMFELDVNEEVDLALTLWRKRWEEFNNGLVITFNKQYVNIGALYEPQLGNISSLALWDWDCPAGRIRICIMPDGSVSPCPLLGSLGLSTGNLREDSLIEIWENSKLFKMVRQEKNIMNSECRDCSFWKLCRGGCKASAYAYFNNLMEIDRLCFKKLGERKWNKRNML